MSTGQLSIAKFHTLAGIGGDHFSPLPFLDVLSDGKYVFGFTLVLSRSAGHHLALHWGGDAAAENRVLDALVRVGLRRAEALLREPEYVAEKEEAAAGGQGGHFSVLLGSDDFEEMRRESPHKQCAYQHAIGRDLYCAAAISSDPSKSRTEADGRNLSPTTPILCGECSLPDTEWLCSSLVHPRVTSLPATRGGAGKRVVASALCSEGKLADASEVHRCRPGGHECWNRSVSRSSAVTIAPVPVWALPDAIDSLDAEWQLTFNKLKLFIPPGMKAPSGIAQGVTTREDFHSRMNDLYEVLNSLRADDSLMEPGKKVPPEGMVRLESCLLHQLDSTQHGQVQAAIATLRNLIGIRTGQTHAARTTAVQACLGNLGLLEIAYDYPKLWEQVRALAVDALRSLKDSVRSKRLA